MLDVPALSVKFVVVAKLSGEAPVDRVIVLLLKFMERTLLLLDESCAAVMLKSLVENVPANKVITPAVRASNKSHVPPVPLNAIDPTDFPFVITTQPGVVAKKFRLMVLEKVPAKNDKSKLPYIFKLGRDMAAKLPVKAFNVDGLYA